MKEMLGVIMGWVVVTVSAWFAALALMGYSLANINPLTWTTEQRTGHLVIQLVLIILYAYLTRPDEERR